jgi:hypothetical protein
MDDKVGVGHGPVQPAAMRLLPLTIMRSIRDDHLPLLYLRPAYPGMLHPCLYEASFLFLAKDRYEASYRGETHLVVLVNRISVESSGGCRQRNLQPIFRWCS